jgi:hypothetical protein
MNADAELLEQVLEGKHGAERAEAVDAIERLSAAVSDMCESFGTIYVAAVLVGLGRKLAARA